MRKDAPASRDEAGLGQVASASQRDRMLAAALHALLNATEVFTRLLGPLLIVFAALLISLMTWTYFDSIMPALGVRVLSPTWCAVTSVGVYILWSLVFNYAMAVMTPPGSPNMSVDAKSQFAGDAAEQVDRDMRVAMAHSAAAPALRGRAPEDTEQAVAPNGGRTTAHAPLARRGMNGLTEGIPDPTAYTMCHKCDALRPPRAHHCHVCNRCVLKMDHHCPWLNNCVGMFNYHFFFKVLVYVWAGCLFIAAVSALPFIDGVAFSVDGSALGGVGNGLAHRAARTPLSQESRLGLCFVLAIAVGFAVGAMMSWHVYLIISGQTSIEFYQNNANRTKLRHRGLVFRNPYDLGPARNWEQALGTASWRWMLPTLRGAPGDGRSFPVLR